MESVLSRPKIIQRVKVRGKYNATKARVLVTLYCAMEWGQMPGLAFEQLHRMSHTSKGYLSQRLPVFSCARRYPLTGQFWTRPLINRKLILSKHQPAFLYSLAADGRVWVEQRLDRAKFWQIVEMLKLRRVDGN